FLFTVTFPPSVSVNELTGGTGSIRRGGFDASSGDRDTTRNRREVGHPLTKSLVPAPHHHLLDIHGSLGLRVGCWLAVEPPADRMGARPAEPPGIPALLHLHYRRVADRWGRRDHRAQVPAAQGMGVRGFLFPILGCRGVAPASRRLCSC